MRKNIYLLISVIFTLNSHITFTMDQIQKIKEEKKEKLTVQNPTPQKTGTTCACCCLDTCGRCMLCTLITIPLYVCCYLMAPFGACLSPCMEGYSEGFLLDEEIFGPPNNITKKLWRNSLLKKYFCKK